MNSGATTVSGLRASAITRRETRKVPKRIPMNLSVHLVLIALSLLVWWIARDLVSVRQTLENASRLKFEISEELKGEWRILGDESVRVSIDVEGPARKLSGFANELSQNPGRYGYVFRVTRADIPDDIGARTEVVLNVDLNDLKPSAEGGEPAELKISPAGERTYQVTLERYIKKAAYVDLESGISGEVQGYTYTKSMPSDTMLQVVGPASKVEALGGTGDRAKVQLRFDVAEFINNRSAAQRKTAADLLGQESRLTTMASIMPREDIVVQQVTRAGKPTDRPAFEIVNQVAIELWFTRAELYEKVQRKFPVTVREPQWLKERGGRVAGNAPDFVVTLDVMASQKDLFNESNVIVLIDLVDLKEDELALDPPQAGKLIGRPQQALSYRLIIQEGKLSYRLPPNIRSLDEYSPVVERLTLEWPN